MKRTDPPAAETVIDLAELTGRMVALADEMVAPMECHSPAYGVPGHAHCAACCYGTGVIITCDEDQALYDAAMALHRAAGLLRRSTQFDGSSDGGA